MKEILVKNELTMLHQKYLNIITSNIGYKMKK